MTPRAALSRALSRGADCFGPRHDHTLAEITSEALRMPGQHTQAMPCHPLWLALSRARFTF